MTCYEGVNCQCNKLIKNVYIAGNIDLLAASNETMYGVNVKVNEANKM